MSFIENWQNKVEGDKLITKLKATNSGSYLGKMIRKSIVYLNYYPQKGDEVTFLSFLNI